MTKKELAVAQFLHTAALRGGELADERDPERKGGDEVTTALARISATASMAFVILTGRHASAVNIVELSTESPAQWAASVPGTAVNSVGRLPAKDSET